MIYRKLLKRIIIINTLNIILVFYKNVCNYIIDNNMVIDKLPFIMRELAHLEYNSHKSFLLEIYFNMISSILFKYR